MNQEKSAFIEGLKSDLKAVGDRIQELKVQAALGRMEAKERYRRRVDELSERYDDLKSKLEDARTSSAETWDDVKTRLSNAWNELEAAVGAAKNVID